MANPIWERTYIRIDGKLASPLLSGSGHNEKTDHDILRDREGRPVVPGSSLAGAFLHQLRLLFPEEELKKLFGTSIRQSRLIVYDMTLNEWKPITRDGVKLDQYKTAVDQEKYDLEAVDRGASYTIRLEWIVRQGTAQSQEKEAQWLYHLIDGLAEGSITIGAKSHRGFGKLTVAGVEYKHFNHRDKEESRKWLSWIWDDLGNGHKWNPGKSQLHIPRSPFCTKAERSLTVPLTISNTLMIRSYIVDIEEQQIEYQQLRSGSDGQLPVIPGSSWAGALRARLLTLLQSFFPTEKKKLEDIVDELFGTSGDKKDSLKASRLIVEESVVKESKKLPVTRNAIDRFTGGTIDGALFSAETSVGGYTELVLRWRSVESELPFDAICGMLLWVIYDLQEGLLAVGGETAIGRGIFKSNGAIRLDGKELEQPSRYLKAATQFIQEKSKEAFA
ncbi:CRISPR/Cas system CSM-associated protein Csm3, group 7 of RAMP superfamily [Evansella caseinilytica]|uniref:CRISPR/Cas system CSM-associated protein Csm3, group 7 of RAMP superfamily n=1 Tax=Evansella caseinilytica TaxID=1503961 RepID=A0A1H3SNK4_9BACI|nr:RAMP superfamily CRISPR-associated protein [Evansella caseinilytica]SDZ39572.1 CRISPR/Cas system CSM-associated protein Csm3, group 7 of RAMP superfamily [Evansella caseinilytica]